MSEARIELEALLVCPTCGATRYRLYRRQLRQVDGAPVQAWENVLWPVERWDVAPPADSAKLVCRACPGAPALRRVAP